ncbi:MFS transporter [Celeribacter marinus]|uniref:Sugar efflux transporter B n=1 Tax=Celeribacter marinus TaxID=1397108 RepID=A0A0N9ZY72_9RHOB|nr:MFS transporter [Celeribacter marinus]ALI55198.1 sugar efflux transporter B [Celeribacter marinus]SFK09180.1 Predicted arabinose efflux permease, MFS family [Celeribacter marinus]
MIDAIAIIVASKRLRASALAVVCIGALAAALAPYQGLIAIKLFGFTDAQFAAIMVIGAAASVVSSLYTGIITDQWASRRTTALICAGTTVVGVGSVYLTRSPIAYLIAATVMIPIGFALMGQMFAIARLAVIERAPAQRDGVMSLIRAGFALPFVIVLPLLSLAIGQGMGLIHLYGVVTLAASGCLIVLFTLLPRDGLEGGEETKSGLSFTQSFAELAHPRVLSRLLLIATLVAANTIYMQTMGLIFEASHPAGTARTAQLAALIAGLEIPFMMLIPWYTARATKSTILLGSAFVYALFLLLFPHVAGGDAVWILAIPAAMGAAVLLTLPIAYFQDLLAARPGASSSLQSVNQVTSQLIAGGIFWIGTSFASYGLVMTIGALTAIGAGIALRVADHQTP